MYDIDIDMAKLAEEEYNSRCEVVGTCAWCREEILDCYDYYKINGELVCEDCIEDCKVFA